MRWLAVVAAVAAFVSPALAQDGHRALAERAIAVIYEDQIADRIMEVFWPVALQAIRERAPGVSALQLFQYESKTMGFADEAAHAGLEPLVDYFAGGYTDEELAAIIAFYGSSAGIKVASTQGAIASLLSGSVGQSLNAEVGTLREKLDALLVADGF